MRSVFRILLLRELYVLRARFWDDFLNGIFVSFLFALTVRYFLPAMGMDPALQFPLFIGGVISLCIRVAYLHCLTITKDIGTSKFIHYQLLHTSGSIQVVVARILGQIISLIAVLIPYMMLGLIMMHGSYVLVYQPFALAAMLFLIASFLTTFCMFWAYTLPLDRYLDLVWPRFLGPMIVFGGMHFTWLRMHTLSPKVATLFLFSPLLYCTEGLRASLFGRATGIPLIYAIAVLTVLSSALLVGCFVQLRKRTDCVIR